MCPLRSSLNKRYLYTVKNINNQMGDIQPAAFDFRARPIVRGGGSVHLVKKPCRIFFIMSMVYQIHLIIRAAGVLPTKIKLKKFNGSQSAWRLGCCFSPLVKCLIDRLDKIAQHAKCYYHMNLLSAILNDKERLFLTIQLSIYQRVEFFFVQMKISCEGYLHSIKQLDFKYSSNSLQ